MTRRYFGTDGVRGSSATRSHRPSSSSGSAARRRIWAGGGARPRGPRHARSGPELEEALARGILSAGGAPSSRESCRRLRSPPRARPRRRRLRVAQPARVQRRQVLRPRRREAHRRGRGGDRGASSTSRRRDRDRSSGTTASSERYLEHVLERFGADLERAADRASTAPTARTPTIAPRRVRAARRRSSRRSAREPDGTNINAGLRRDRPPRAAADGHRATASTSASRSTATATACSRSTRTARRVDGDQILAILALHLGVDLVAVTSMTNLGFHQLMDEHGASAWSRPTSATATCSRRCGARAACSAASSPATSSTCDDHVTGDGLVGGAAPLRRARRAGRSPRPRR